MFETLERGLYWMTSFLQGGDIDAHVQLAAPFAIAVPEQGGDGVAEVDGWVTSRNGLVSVIELGGMRQLVGVPEYELAVENLARILTPVLQGSSMHSVSIGFRSNPAGGGRVVRDALAAPMTTARRYGVDDMSFFDAQIGRLGRAVTEESLYLVLSTTMAGLPVAERKRALEQREEANKSLAKLPHGMRMDDVISQNPRTPLAPVIKRHSATLRTLVSQLSQDIRSQGVGLNCRLLDAQEAAAAIRRHVDASDYPSGWRPVVLGSDEIRPPTGARRDRNNNHLTPMRLGRQIFKSKTVEIFGDFELVRRDGVYYGGLVVEAPTRNQIPSFGSLSRLLGREIPFTFSMEILPGGAKSRGADRFFAGIVGAMGDHNRRVAKAWRILKSMRGTVVGVRLILSTWSTDRRKCEDQLAAIRAQLEQWGGGCPATNETGAPGVLSLGYGPGLAAGVPAPVLPGPLEEMVRMVPFFRPQSVWSTGQIMTVTDEGRLYPVQLGSSEQAFWGTLNFAPSGSGKSFLFNLLNAGLIFSPGQETLPLITMVDVGPSAKLVHDLTKALLPPRMANQILYLRVRNSIEYSVNPWDTELGCDRPTDVSRSALLNAVMTLATNMGGEGERFVGDVINKTYERFGRSSPEQRVWQESLDPALHAQLKRVGLELTDKTFVWEVVDYLFDAGLVDVASRAQRYAMPRMPDMVASTRAREILDNWRTAPTPSGELMMDAFQRAITTGANEFAMLYDFTRFDVGNARAVFVDLEEVVTADESETGRRRAALMFAAGRRIGAKSYFLRWEEVQGIVPPRYAAYHEDRIVRLAEEMKFLEYDEVHYATGIESLSKLLERDLRVGRKYKIVTSMASQRLQDFTPGMIDNCYTFFLLGVGTDNSLAHLQKTFGLSDTEVAALAGISRPGRMLALFKTNRGRVSQVLNVVASGFVTWAFSTSATDKLVREELARRYHGDLLRALRDLTALYPGGSATKAVEAYRAGKDDSADDKGITEGFVLRVVLPELERRNRRQQAAEDAASDELEVAA